MDPDTWSSGHILPEEKKFRLKERRKQSEAQRHFPYQIKKTVVEDIPLGKRFARVWSKGASKDKGLEQTLKRIDKLPEIYPYMAVMPDYHLGDMWLNGLILPTRDVIYPQAIGGDAGCGFTLMTLPIFRADIQDHLPGLYKALHAAVPTGRHTFTDIAEEVRDHPIFSFESDVFNKSVRKKAQQQLGTVGDGNHFLELLTDHDDRIYALVHTGSRYLGQVIRTRFTRPEIGERILGGTTLLEADSAEGADYLRHVEFATAYARANRKQILDTAVRVLASFVPGLGAYATEQLPVLDAPHNLVQREHVFGKTVLVHRKGANYVPEGTLSIIAGSVNAPSYVVEGKGNPYAFFSSSHGAGRNLSRGQAFRSIGRDDLAAATEGVMCRKDASAVDEAPQAYKDISRVMRYQKDLVARRNELQPLLNIRG